MAGFEFAEAETQIVVSANDELGEDALARAEVLLTDPKTPGEGDLQNWRIRDDQLSFDAAVSADLPVANIDASFSRRVVIRDVARYTERTSGSSLQQWGVAIRLIVTVWAAKIEGRLTLPVVAAQAQLGMVSASAELQVLGFKNNEVGSLLPKFESMDVGSYNEYTKASDRIRDYISKHKDDIVPVLLKTAEKPPAHDLQLTKAVGTARALRYLGRRRALEDAIDGLEGWPDLAEIVKSTYAQFGQGAEPTKPAVKIAQDAQRWASWIGD